jgi:hypothetical protein
LGACALAISSFAMLATSAAPAGAGGGGGTEEVSPNTVVASGSATGWYFWNDSSDTEGGPGSFVDGPGAAPLGDGSVQVGPLTATSGDGAHATIATNAYNGTLLSDLSGLGYSTYTPTGAASGNAVTLQFDVDLASAPGSWCGRVVFEPSNDNGTVTPDTWQTWDASAGNWWSTKNPATCASWSSGVGSIADPQPWSWVETTFNSVFGRTLLKAGSGWNGFDGSADNLMITAGATATTFDFEPTTPCTTTCYVDASVATTGNGDPATPFKSIQEGIDAVDANGTVRVLPGDYSEAAPGSQPVNGGTYQFGLYVDDSKPGITVQGVTAADADITSAVAVEANITTQSTSNFGPSGVFVEGDGVTFQGLHFGKNTVLGDAGSYHNKTIEVIGDDFSLLNSVVEDPPSLYTTEGEPYSGGVYINDFRYAANGAGVADDASHVMTYTIQGNSFLGSILTIASGAGVSGDVSSRTVTGNTFTQSADDTFKRPSINVRGAGGRGWYFFPVGGFMLTGNTFTNTDPTGLYVGTTQGPQIGANPNPYDPNGYDNSQFDWASFFADNDFTTPAQMVLVNPPGDVRTYSEGAGANEFTQARRIAVAEPAFGVLGSIAESGDTIQSWPPPLIAAIGTLSGKVTDLAPPKGTNQAFGASGVAGVIACADTDPTCAAAVQIDAAANGDYSDDLEEGTYDVAGFYCKASAGAACDDPSNPAVHVGPSEMVVITAASTTTHNVKVGFRPDSLARRLGVRSPFRGNNTYAPTRIDTRLRPHHRVESFAVKIENDGLLTETINVKAVVRGSGNLSYSIRQGPFNVPNMTTAGRNYTLIPGASTTLKVNIRAGLAARGGQSKLVVLVAKSKGQATGIKTDQARLRATYKP